MVDSTSEYNSTAVANENLETNLVSLDLNSKPCSELWLRSKRVRSVFRYSELSQISSLVSVIKRGIVPILTE